MKVTIDRIHYESSGIYSECECCQRKIVDKEYVIGFYMTELTICEGCLNNLEEAIKNRR